MASQIILYTLTGAVALAVSWLLWFKLIPMIVRMWGDQSRRMRERKEGDARQQAAVDALLGAENRRKDLTGPNLIKAIVFVAIISASWMYVGYEPWGHFWIGVACVAVLLAIYVFKRMRADT